MPTSKERFLALVPTKPSGWDHNFRVPKMPKIRENVSSKNLLEGLAAHDLANEEWRANLERSIEDRINQAQNISTTIQTTVETAGGGSGTAPPSSSVAPVTSVNAMTGDVLLTTADIPEAGGFLYLTLARWNTFYDQAGYARNMIALGEMITVPGARSMVTVGLLTIAGRLTIDGHLAVLPSPA